MSIITKSLKQIAVYWAPGSPDGDGGFADVTPVEISCRWDDVIGKVTDPKTQNTYSNATVYVDRDVEVGGFLYLGELTDLDSDVSPEDAPAGTSIKKIVGFSKIANLKATEYWRTVSL